MAIKSNAEWVEYYDDLIQKVGAVRRVVIDGKEWSIQDLDKLHALRNSYFRAYKAEQGTGGPVISVGLMRRG